MDARKLAIRLEKKTAKNTIFSEECKLSATVTIFGV